MFVHAIRLALNRCAGLCVLVILKCTTYYFVSGNTSKYRHDTYRRSKSRFTSHSNIKILSVPEDCPRINPRVARRGLNSRRMLSTLRNQQQCALSLITLVIIQYPSVDYCNERYSYWKVNRTPRSVIGMDPVKSTCHNYVDLCLYAYWLLDGAL